MDTEGKLEQYVLLAGKARGLALLDIIKRATSEESTYGFGELLAVPSVQQLKATEHSQHFALLELFAYGTWPDYREHQQQLPELTAAQAGKLKQLTVVSLATQHKVLPYKLVMQQLEMTSLREFEDFIITQCIYSGLMDARLDQQQSQVLVLNAFGRDVRTDQLPALVASLETWAQHTKQVMAAIEHNHTAASTCAKTAKTLAEQRAKEQADVVAAVKAAGASDVGQAGEYIDGMDVMAEDRLPAPARPKRSRRGMQ